MGSLQPSVEGPHSILMADDPTLPLFPRSQILRNLGLTVNQLMTKNNDEYLGKRLEESCRAVMYIATFSSAFVHDARTFHYFLL